MQVPDRHPPQTIHPVETAMQAAPHRTHACCLQDVVVLCHLMDEAPLPAGPSPARCVALHAPNSSTVPKGRSQGETESGMPP